MNWVEVISYPGFTLFDAFPLGRRRSGRETTVEHREMIGSELDGSREGAVEMSSAV